MALEELCFFLENWPFKLGKNLWRYSLRLALHLFIRYNHNIWCARNFTT